MLFKGLLQRWMEFPARLTADFEDLAQDVWRLLIWANLLFLIGFAHISSMKHRGDLRSEWRRKNALYPTLLPRVDKKFSRQCWTNAELNCIFIDKDLFIFCIKHVNSGRAKLFLEQLCLGYQANKPTASIMAWKTPTGCQIFLYFYEEGFHQSMAAPWGLDWYTPLEFHADWASYYCSFKSTYHGMNKKETFPIRQLGENMLWLEANLFDCRHCLMTWTAVS